MAINFVQSKSISAPVTPELAFDSDNTVDNLLISVVRASGVDPATFSYRDTLGNIVDGMTPKYTTVGGVVDSTQVFIVHNCKAGANTLTITPSSGTVLYIAIHEFSGVNTVDQVAIATGTGLSQDSGPITTLHTDELLFGYEDAAIQATVTGDPDWTTAEFHNVTFLTQYKIVSSTGTYNSTTTATAGKSGVVNWTEEIISFYNLPNVTNTQIITF